MTCTREERMWVFAYGSLMSEPWEREFGGSRRGSATLAGYRRAFSKASTTNWGTKDTPCPTLGLEPDEGARCIGIVFEFSDTERQRVLSFLQKREGPSFTIQELEVRLLDGLRIRALTPVNDRSRRSYIGSASLNERARMATSAEGTKGRCIDYIKKVRDNLRQIGVLDEYVEQFWRAIRDP